MKRILVSLLSLGLVFSLAACGADDKADSNNDANTNQEQQVATNKVTDVIGREFEVPANAQNVVILPSPAFEKSLVLGAADQVGGMLKSAFNPWAAEVYPEIDEIVSFDSSKQPNIETMMTLGTEFVICHDYPDLMTQFDDIEMPYVVTQCSGETPYQDIDGFLNFQKSEVHALAEAFGGDAIERAEKWCNYYDEKVEYVLSKTAELSDEERPKVYYARSDEGLVTFSKYSYPHFLVEIAGGYYVSQDTDQEMNTTLTIEKIMEWNPDIIFMGRMSDVGIVTENPAWSGIKAVEDGNVFLCPTGVFNWDYSGENILLLLHLAKNIHPDLFEDLDLAEEIKYYYSTFYGYELDDDGIERIMNRQLPASAE